LGIFLAWTNAQLAIKVDAARAGLRPARSDHSEKFNVRRARSTSLLIIEERIGRRLYQRQWVALE